MVGKIPGPGDRSGRGFTLIQCLAGVAILTVIAGLLAPDASRILAEHQGRSVLARLAALISLARAEAARQNVMATLCPSSDGQHCTNDWNHGVLLFLDRDDNQIPDTEDLLVQYLGWQDPGGRLHWRAFRSKPYLQITPLGFTRYQNGNFTWCDADSSPVSARQLILNHTGRIRFSLDTNGDGLHEDSQGQPISCPH